MKQWLCSKTGLQLFVEEDGKVFYINGKKKKINYSSSYPRLDLYKEGKRASIALHIVLATLFIPNPDSKPFINHRDGNKQNYSLNNLEWCTHSENMKHAISTGLLTNCTLKGENHNTSKHTWEEIRSVILLS